VEWTDAEFADLLHTALARYARASHALFTGVGSPEMHQARRINLNAAKAHLDAVYAEKFRREAGEDISEEVTT
jgi:hypothetical protein